MGPPSEADSLTTILKCELRCKDQRWKQWEINTWKEGGRGARGVPAPPPTPWVKAASTGLSARWGVSASHSVLHPRVTRRKKPQS